MVAVSIPAEGQGPPETWKVVVVDGSAACVPLELAELLVALELGTIVADCPAPREKGRGPS